MKKARFNDRVFFVSGLEAMMADRSPGYGTRTILLATDAWLPQVNGVVRTYQRLIDELAPLGVTLVPLGPENFKTVPLPSYPEIRLAWCRPADIDRAMQVTAADAIHIPTEGPIGWAARRWCLRTNTPFTTCFHTRFPEYVAARLPFVCPSVSYALLRRFHNASNGTLVATPSMASDLGTRGFNKIRPWTRGVDLTRYAPRDVRNFGTETVMLYVGRVAIEKNIEAFLELDTPGRKVVVGDGPALKALTARYPQVLFTGKLESDALADAYASADVFVFPSRTDTFGIVMLEAIASGVPVAAYPVTGPIDVVRNGVSGALNDDLSVAITQALTLDRETVRRAAQEWSWTTCATQFLAHVASANGWQMATSKIVDELKPAP